MRAIKLTSIAMILLLTSSCSWRVSYTDVSDKERYRHLVGAKYETIKWVTAYFMRWHPSETLEYVTIEAPPGFAGRDIKSKVLLEPGTIIVVNQVMESNRLLECDISFIVTVEGLDVPPGIPVQLDLFSGNQGDGCPSVNPEAYRLIK